LNVGHAHEAVEVIYRRRINPGPKKVKWKVFPPSVKVLAVGLGAALDGFAASAAREKRPTPTTAPVAPMDPMNALRDSACRA
jgi:hypothetical protein